eukprot:GHVU01157902.1.p1 GENE.GHVU01157902.1~~GHVU01157902.1.p1  ORF type:complete len:512 (+),score=69.64 GHVU01157902.1:1317-2852(+)
MTRAASPRASVAVDAFRLVAFMGLFLIAWMHPGVAHLPVSEATDSVVRPHTATSRKLHSVAARRTAAAAAHTLSSSSSSSSSSGSHFLRSFLLTRSAPPSPALAFAAPHVPSFSPSPSSSTYADIPEFIPAMSAVVAAAATAETAETAHPRRRIPPHLHSARRDYHHRGCGGGVGALRPFSSLLAQPIPSIGDGRTVARSLPTRGTPGEPSSTSSSSSSSSSSVLPYSSSSSLSSSSSTSPWAPASPVEREIEVGSLEGGKQTPAALPVSSWKEPSSSSVFGALSSYPNSPGSSDSAGSGSSADIAFIEGDIDAPLRGVTGGSTASAHSRGDSKVLDSNLQVLQEAEEGDGENEESSEEAESDWYTQMKLSGGLGTPLLDAIEGPEDLKAFDLPALSRLAEEVRSQVIQSVSQTGGHFGAGLGVCELTVALHHVFDAPHDRIVFDVSHQAYPHKILTGRRDRMLTIRKRLGLSGFCKRSESPYDSFGAGSHAYLLFACTYVQGVPLVQTMF